MLIAYDDETILKEIKDKLKSEIEVKDLGEANYCVGIEILRKNRTICLIQRKHINKIVEKFNLIDAKVCATPVDRSLLYTLKKNRSNLNLPYQELIGSLMYVSVATRPDVMLSVVFLSQFNTCFGTEHWNAAKGVVKYLKSTIDFGLIFKKDVLRLNVYFERKRLEQK